MTGWSLIVGGPRGGTVGGDVRNAQTPTVLHARPGPLQTFNNQQPTTNHPLYDDAASNAPKSMPASAGESPVRVAGMKTRKVVPTPSSDESER